MNLSEVIRKDKQRDGGFQVVPFAAESIRQAGKSAHSHPHRQVHPLNVRRANHIAVRVAEPRFNDRAFQFGWTVPRRAVSHAAVDLDKLAIVNAGSETQANGIWISGHAVSGQLKLTDRCLIQLLDKDFGVDPAASAKMPCKDDLTVALNGEERVSIALSLVIHVAFVPFLAVDKAPQLIGLYVTNGHFADLLLQNALALLASDPEHSETLEIVTSHRRAVLRTEQPSAKQSRMR